MNLSLLQYVYFFILCVLITYFLNCIIAKKFLKIKPKMAMLYYSTLVLIGIFGEIFINRLYEIVFGQPLWTYEIAPIHDSLSSKYAFFLWGVYGFHLYLLHEALGRWKINSTKYMTYIFGFEGVLFEFIANSLFILSFDRYLYYYPANDLWHITSIQAFPFYIAGGWVIVRSLKRFKKDPKFFIVMNLLLTGVIVFLA